MIRRGGRIAALAVLAAVLSLYVPIPKSRLSPLPVLSLNVLDRAGRPLREILSDEGGRCRWIGLSDISPCAAGAAIAAEDRRFFFHRGVDLPAIARAAFQALRRGRVVSGASTITQQVIRNIYRFRRTIPAKIAEAWLAVRLEHTLSKGEILAQYLNRIAYGRQAYGIEAASRFYFDKPALDLSPSEAAYLAALPRSPGLFVPERDASLLRAQRDAILRKMARNGFLPAGALSRALAEPLRITAVSRPFRAPHFVEYAVSRLSPAERSSFSEIRTTLDLPLQIKIEALLAGHVRTLEKRGLTNGAVVVLENDTRSVRAMAGSIDYFDERRDGQVNGAIALRQPGSALKPLTYALALEKGMTAATLIDDAPTEFGSLNGSFAPENYDARFHGPVRLRSALASSYNVPAVAVLSLLGPDLLFRKLQEMGFRSLQKDPSHYGVGLTLGNGEVTLLELARAYAALARGGLYAPDRTIEAAVRKDGRSGADQAAPVEIRVFSSAASFIVTDILSDRDARVPTFGYGGPLSLPFPAAVKTGTSKDFRDNWTVGYTPRYTVAVWMGNFDGSPMRNVSGVTGAGPLFRDVVLLLEGSEPDVPFAEPPGLIRADICPVSGELPSPDCPAAVTELFIPGTAPRTKCRFGHQEASGGPGALRVAGRSSEPLQVVFPAEGDVFKMDAVLRPEFQALTLRARVEADPLPDTVTWIIDGVPEAVVRRPFSRSWKLRPGSVIIKVRAVLNGRTVESRPVKIQVLS